MPLLTPHVPNGLIDCMKDLAKEVLREKPENIYEFAAIHFEKLILQRDGSMDKGYETFTEFEAYFDGKQRFAVPSNYGFICHRAIKTQSQTKKSKSDIMASFQAMESINEEDVLAPIPTSAPTPATAPTQAPESVIPLEGTNILYEDEKYQKAIYVIQRFFRRYKAKKEHSSTMNTNTTTKQSLSAFTAAIIIQRTMQRLFSNKIKLKKDKEKDSGLSSATSIVSAAAATAAAVKVVHDDMDSVSEAASYTSSSTIQMLAEGQEGRENRLASGQSRQEEREEGLDDDVDCNGNVDVDGAADFSSLVFKEPSQDGEPPSSPATAVVSVDNGDDEEHSHSVASAAVTVTEVDRKSIAVENGN